MNKYKVGLVSLGCDKNRIDSEIILSSMSKSYQITNNPKDAEIIIINTCGFIESAKQESINTILEMAEHKKNDKCKLLIATGCLTQRYGNELKELIPEIDIMLGVNDYKKLHILIQNFLSNKKEHTLEVNYSDDNINEGDRILTTDKHTAYLRIAEGCNNFCTYCIIPKIRGKFRSRSIESIAKEAQKLANKGAKELVLVAQDTTMYGFDIYGEKRLHILLKELSSINEIKWIRILYCYPEEIYDELLFEMERNEKVLNYLDLPIQHISNKILKLMGRKTTKEDIIKKINLIRKRLTNPILRTSLIVGFPNETLEDFNELKDFLREQRLQKVGVFKYSLEEGTPAAKMEGQIDENVKESREKELMLLQSEISRSINEEKIGRIFDVLIESYNGEYYKGRSFEMAPEIDGNIYVKTDKALENGTFVKAEITDCTNYDLVGVVVHESSK